MIVPSIFQLYIKHPSNCGKNTRIIEEKGYIEIPENDLSIETSFIKIIVSEEVMKIK